MCDPCRGPSGPRSRREPARPARSPNLCPEATSAGPWCRRHRSAIARAAGGGPPASPPSKQQRISARARRAGWTEGLHRPAAGADPLGPSIGQLALSASPPSTPTRRSAAARCAGRT
eukprot:13566322-Heterocapsa_arctica.AAC.1